MNRSRYQNHKNENTVIKYLNNIQKNRILKVKKRPFAKNTWYDWLINCILEPIKITVGGVKEKILSLFKTSTSKCFKTPTRDKNVYGGEKKPRKLKRKK